MLVALLTDFGTKDVYVGVMKAVIAGVAPGVPVIDLTHEVEPQAVDEAAFLLAQAVPFLPPGAVVCAVVDPGVGSARRAVVVEVDGRRYVAPDNGLLTPVLFTGAPTRARELTNPAIVDPGRSATFHGRDVFSPAAAFLAGGGAWEDVGPEVDPGTLFELAPNRGRVVHVDRFGNLVTDLPADQLPPDCGLRVGEAEVRRRVRTYADAPVGELVVLEGSSGHLEVSVVQGDAARRLGVARGVEAAPLVAEC